MASYVRYTLGSCRMRSSKPRIGKCLSMASRSSSLTAGNTALSCVAVAAVSFACPRNSCAVYVFVNPSDEASSSNDRPAASFAFSRRADRAATSVRRAP
eukprot:788008-Prymnesium_polylepis.1